VHHVSVCAGAFQAESKEKILGQVRSLVIVPLLHGLQMPISSSSAQSSIWWCGTYGGVVTNAGTTGANASIHAHTQL
jgi:hypothetical protein